MEHHREAVDVDSVVAVEVDLHPVAMEHPVLVVSEVEVDLVVEHHPRATVHRPAVVEVADTLEEVEVEATQEVAEVVEATPEVVVVDHQAVTEHHQEEGHRQAMGHLRVAVLEVVVSVVDLEVAGHPPVMERHRTEVVADRLRLTGHRPLVVTVVSEVVVVAAAVSVAVDTPVEHPRPVTVHLPVVEAAVADTPVVAAVVGTPAVEVDLFHHLTELLPSEVAAEVDLEVVSVAVPAVTPVEVVVVADPHRVTEHPASEVVAVLAEVARVTPATVVTNTNHHAMCSSRELRSPNSSHLRAFSGRITPNPEIHFDLTMMIENILTSYKHDGDERGCQDLASNPSSEDFTNSYLKKRSFNKLAAVSHRGKFSRLKSFEIFFKLLFRNDDVCRNGNENQTDYHRTRMKIEEKIRNEKLTEQKEQEKRTNDPLFIFFFFFFFPHSKSCNLFIL